MDSINKIINACNISFEQFYSLIDEELQPESLNSVPYIKFSELENGINILNDEPQTDSWTRKNFPATTAGLYGIELDVDDYAPLYRKKLTIIAAKNAEICKGDRMVVFCKNNDILIKGICTPHSHNFGLKRHYGQPQNNRSQYYRYCAGQPHLLGQPIMPGSSKYLQQSSEALEQTELRYDVLPAEPVQLSDASLDKLCRRQTQEAARRRPSPGDSRAIQDSCAFTGIMQ